MAERLTSCDPHTPAQSLSLSISFDPRAPGPPFPGSCLLRITVRKKYARPTHWHNVNNVPLSPAPSSSPLLTSCYFEAVLKQSADLGFGACGACWKVVPSPFQPPFHTQPGPIHLQDSQR